MVQEQDAPRMTMRISLDGGRTYGEPIKVTKADEAAAVTDTVVFPPCQCPAHRQKERQ